MKAVTCCLIAFLICNAECGRKVVQPLDRRANDDFIKMEGGGGVRPAAPAVAPAFKPDGGAQPQQAVTPPKPQPQPAVTPPKPQPQPAVTPPKPATHAVTPPKPAVPEPSQPARQPAPGASAAPKPTPGPGSVQ